MHFPQWPSSTLPKKPWLDRPTLPLCQRFPYARFNAVVTKISKWSRIQDSCRITPKIESLVAYAMPDRPSKFQKDPSITFWVILYTHTHTDRQTKTGKNITSLAEVMTHCNRLLYLHGRISNSAHSPIFVRSSSLASTLLAELRASLFGLILRESLLPWTASGGAWWWQQLWAWRQQWPVAGAAVSILPLNDPITLQIAVDGNVNVNVIGFAIAPPSFSPKRYGHIQQEDTAHSNRNVFILQWLFETVRCVGADNPCGNR